MKLRRLRAGESLALLGAIGIAVALTMRWYEAPQGNLDAWNTFGPTIALLILAAGAGFWLALATVTERTVALPIAAAVWGTLLGFCGVVSAAVRLLERPDHATMLCAGAWIAFAGALLVLIGCWQSMRDERTGLYTPAEPPVRPAPPA
jgi:hypothetical protein